ncbi:MAG TPA: cytochrome c oxidase subunit 3 [Thermoanaerobaculia bacterium]
MKLLDVSGLPMETADSRALLWWGNVGMLVIEGTMFAMLIATFLYLKTANLDWPPQNIQLPPVIWPSIALGLLIVSGFFMYFLADRGAMKDDVGSVRIGHIICIAIGIAFLIIRWKDVAALGFKWSDHAYGSIVWTCIGMHTFHMLAATGETISLLVYESVWPVTKKQLLDIRCTCVYWYFVVIAWIPFYLLIYIAPYSMRKG